MKYSACAALCCCILTWAVQGEEFPVTAFFLSGGEARTAIMGDEEDEFFSKLFPREAAAMTGVPREQKTKQQCREFARDFFGKAVLEFNQNERDALQLVIKRLHQRFADVYPRLVLRPWRFIKTRRDLCGGFSFTRGDCIVLSESTLANIVETVAFEPPPYSQAESLLLHEQMHVLQREDPKLFEPLYRDTLHFQPARVVVHPWIDERQVTNPDGVSDGWVTFTGTNGTAQPIWLGTLLLTDKQLHAMGRDFTTVAVRLSQTSGGYEMIVDGEGMPRFEPLHDMTSFTSRLPIRPGYDHVNEVAAYLFTVITHGPMPEDLSTGAKGVLERAHRWFAENLKDVE